MGHEAGAERVGMGGGLRYITEEPTPDMVNQELSHSCQAACARQLLMDAGVSLSEDEILDRVGYIEGWGTTAKGAASALDELHPTLGYAGGCVDDHVVAILFKRDPWIATLMTDGGSFHAVIVDRLIGDVVHIRDPWGQSGPGSGTGVNATINLIDFMEHWNWGFNNAVFPNRAK